MVGLVGKRRHDLKPKRILLVDDEQDILDIQSRVLTAAGYCVDTACDGLVALRKLAAEEYALIVSNLRMPELGGEALYRRLCISYPHLRRRVVFCTGDTANQDTLRFLTATGAPVLLKPFTIDALLATVSQALGTAVPRVVPTQPIRSEVVLATP
jgi:DNA-binding response OmpR family regulator